MDESPVAQSISLDLIPRRWRHRKVLASEHTRSPSPLAARRARSWSSAAARSLPHGRGARDRRRAVCP